MKERLSALSFLWLSLFCASTLIGQTITIVDESGLPLVGVNVVSDDYMDVTDINGKVDITSASDNTITLSYLGYEDLLLNKNNLPSLINMVPADHIVEEIIVIGRTNAKEIDLPYAVESIDAKKIFESNVQNTADALTKTGGAYVQKSQLGGGSPILRGFEANKILLVVDGVRMNNAIYRSGHLQNAITIDPNILKQMEVIYGAGSLLYGSEALGGVVHFRTKSPRLVLGTDENKSNKLSLATRYASAAKEWTLHGDHIYASKNIGVLTSITYAERGDLRAGARRRSAYPDFGKRTEYVEIKNGQTLIQQNSNPNIQIGTGYNQLDLLQKWSFLLSDNLQSEINIQFSTSTDIPRYDNLSEYRNGTLRFAEWYYGPQNRVLVSPKLIWQKETKLWDEVIWIGSYQDIDESRNSRSISSNILEQQNENVKVLGTTVDFKKKINARQNLSYGIDMHYNKVSSNSSGVDITSATEQSILTRYPSGGSSLLNSGLYVQHILKNKSEKISWINGIRWTRQVVTLGYDRADPFSWPEYFYDGINNYSDALVGISGINLNIDNYIAKLSTGTSFRSPNVDDLAKVRVNGNEITVPNPNLNPERVWNNELTLGIRKEHLTFGITGFYSFLSDAIVRQNFTLPSGSSLYITQGDTLQVTANVNAESGSIKGLSSHLEINYKKLNFKTTVSSQVGIQKDAEGTEGPLGHIPPTYGNNSISYQVLPSLKISLNHQFNLWKHVEDYGGSVDNLDLATQDGTPEWHVIDISANVNLDKWQMNISLDNISDLHYRPFASGVSAAGRQVIIGLRYAIN